MEGIIRGDGALAEKYKRNLVSFLKQNSIALGLAMAIFSTNVALLYVFVDYVGSNFVDSFEEQNSRELASGSTFEISTRLSSVTKQPALACVLAEKNGTVFLNQSDGAACRQNIFSKWYFIDRLNTGGIKISVLVSVPPSWAVTSVLATLAELILLAAYTVAVGAVKRKSTLFEAELILAQERILRQEFETKFNTANAIARTTAMLSHDVRKPFSLLKAIIQTVKEIDSPHELKEVLEEALPEVDKAIGSVEGLIADVMQVGNDSKLKLEAASPIALVRNALCELFSIGEANVKIETEFAHGHLAIVDTARLQRVFLNILGNAVQAMHSQGTIWIKTSEANDAVTFTFGNSGSFIKPEELPQLFEAFYTSGKKGGTGLGLAIAKKIVELHGGTISCHSEMSDKYPLGMVEFNFLLPLSLPVPAGATAGQMKDEESSINFPTHSREFASSVATHKIKIAQESLQVTELEEQITEHLQANNSTLRILVTDDEPIYQRAIADLLKGSSVQSHISLKFAKSPAECVSLVTSFSPNLLIQDIDLGAELNGLQVVSELRKSGFEGHICIHSNRFLFEEVGSALQHGANAVLPKPLSKGHFFKLMLASMRSSSNLQATPNIANSSAQASALSVKLKPRFAYIDESVVFLQGTKFKLGESAEVIPFKSSNKFFAKLQEDQGFLDSIDFVVTDFYFADGDEHDGETLALELRRMGFQKPILLASNGDHNLTNGPFTAAVEKPISSLESLMKHAKHIDY